MVSWTYIAVIYEHIYDVFFCIGCDMSVERLHEWVHNEIESP